MTDAKNTPMQAVSDAEEIKPEHSISTLAVLAVLKQSTSKEKALPASRLAERAQFMGLQLEEKTIFRKLTSLCELFDSLENSKNPAKKEIYHALLSTCAGRVQREERAPKRPRRAGAQSGRPQYVFYFEPIFQKSEVKMINSSIISNQYLSEEEKRYLLFSEYCLYGTEEPEAAGAFAKLPEKRKGQILKSGGPTGRDPHRKLLEIIDALYSAMEKEQIVEMIYGRYGKGVNGRVALLPAHDAKTPDILHPYAMLWCNGQYYLVATRHTDGSLRHYRIDRILAVKPWFDREKGEIGQRAPIPDTLKKFFTCKRGKYFFLPEKYIKTYPLMSIREEDRIIRCRMYCHSRALSVVVDHFGREQAVRVLKTEQGSEDERFLIELEAQYESILLFCLQQNRVVTALEPKELVEDIKEGLRKHLQRYQNQNG